MSACECEPLFGGGQHDPWYWVILAISVLLLGAVMASADEDNALSKMEMPSWGWTPEDLRAPSSALFPSELDSLPCEQSSVEFYGAPCRSPEDRMTSL